MTRRFEFVSGNSAKFWEIRLAGTAVTVRFGRLGTEGQMQAKTFPSPEALATLRALGVTHVTVHVAAFEQRSGAVALDAVTRRTELHLVADEGGIRLYQVR